LSGDFANVSTVIRPAGSEGAILVRGLQNGAVAVALEPDGRKAYVWLVNLHRQMQQYLMDLPPGITVTAYKRNVELPPVPPGEPANAGLMGGEGTVWVAQSKSPIDAQRLLAAVRAGRSR
jgi:hypothetical protein